MADRLTPETVAQLDAAVAEVFALMLGRNCSPRFTETASQPGFTASVSFTGVLRGECALHLDAGSAGLLTAELMGVEVAEDEALHRDTVGEICNMIAGSWKSRLAAGRAPCELSPPIISAGPGGLGASDCAGSLVRTYRFDASSMTLKLCFR